MQLAYMHALSLPPARARVHDRNEGGDSVQYTYVTRGPILYLHTYLLHMHGLVPAWTHTFRNLCAYVRPFHVLRVIHSYGAASASYMHPRLICTIVRTYGPNLASPILNFRNTLATHHATFVRVLNTIFFLFFESLSKNKTHLYIFLLLQP
jgi:hypothetical protein